MSHSGAMGMHLPLRNRERMESTVGLGAGRAGTRDRDQNGGPTGLSMTPDGQKVEADRREGQWW